MQLVVLAGMAITEILDPQNPTKFKDIIYIKTAEISVIGLVVLGGASLFFSGILSNPYAD